MATFCSSVDNPLHSKTNSYYGADFFSVAIEHLQGNVCDLVDGKQCGPKQAEKNKLSK
jgi:hypothetical protein